WRTVIKRPDMPASLPSDIRVEVKRDDVSYWLPRRPLGKLRWIGLVLVVFGMVFIVGPAAGSSGFLKNFLAGKGGIAEGVFLVFLIPFMIVGLMSSGIGCLIMFG